MTTIGSDSCPLITVVIPVRNEAGFIAALLASVFAQDYPPERVEVIVADGMSTDGTREILARLQREHPRLIVVDNPEHIVPTGLNRAVERARGDVIVRIDGHALIAPDFLRQNVALLDEHPEAWCVGGPIRHGARSTFGKAVAIAMSHPLGVGNAPHRFENYEGYAESAQFPALRRWVFDRIGTFDERLVRNQDDEFTYRIGRAGGRVYVSPRVRYTYFVRERAGHLFRQYVQYGFWRIPVIEKHRRPTTIRHLAPSIFFGLCGLFAVVGLWWGKPLVTAALPSAYAAALVTGTAGVARKNGLRIAACVPAAIATMHAGYALGIAWGIWTRLFRRSAWERPGRMAAISR